MIELKVFEVVNDFILYDYVVGGRTLGQFEVGFDNEEFNGTIVYAGFQTEDENGEFDWIEVTKECEVYKAIRDRAIKDYNET